MELSNLRPAAGSKHSNNFRKGRGHGSETERQQVTDIRDRRHVQEHPDPDLRVARCPCTEDFPRGASRIATE